jgi:HPt (histidine-containing phosphotransfer) domain-containing protein
MYDTPEFQALRREYLQGAVGRMAHLQAEADSLRQGLPVDLRALRQEVHKLRGSGGFYGFHDLSAAAAEAEETLILVLDEELGRDDRQIAALVDRVVQAVAEAAAKAGL